MEIASDIGCWCIERDLARAVKLDIAVLQDFYIGPCRKLPDFSREINSRVVWVRYCYSYPMILGCKRDKILAGVRIASMDIGTARRIMMQMSFPIASISTA